MSVCSLPILSVLHLSPQESSQCPYLTHTPLYPCTSALTSELHPSSPQCLPPRSSLPVYSVPCPPILTPTQASSSPSYSLVQSQSHSLSLSTSLPSLPGTLSSQLHRRHLQTRPPLLDKITVSDRDKWIYKYFIRLFTVTSMFLLQFNGALEFCLLFASLSNFVIRLLLVSSLRCLMIRV